MEGYLTKNAVIVDYGCGSGRFCAMLQKFAKTLYCVDIDKAALKEVESRFPNTIAYENLDKIPTGSVDYVLMANSFHDFSDRRSAVEGIRQILKDEGRVIVVDFEKREMDFGPPLGIRMSKEDYLSFFVGFRLVDEFKPADSHYGLVLAKSEG